MQSYMDNANWLRNYAQEIALFGAMCSDKKLMIVIATIDSERTIEDYVKLICLTKIFGFGRMLKKLCDDAGDRLNEIRKDILRLKNRKQTFIKWMTDFIKGVPDQLLRDWAIESWEEKNIVKTKIVIADVNDAITRSKLR